MHLFRISMVILVLVIGLKLYDILPIKATETKTLDKAESAFKETQEMDYLLEGPLQEKHKR